jgi:hypothetical protein
MNIFKSVGILSCLALACVAFAPTAVADVSNQATKLHFNKPIEVPGVVLPAGTYWFVPENNQGDRNIVEIFNARRTQLVATVATIPALRADTHGRIEVVLAQQHHSPDALWKLYYPGLETGHQFLYPEHEQKRLRQDKEEVVLTPPLSAQTAGGVS